MERVITAERKIDEQNIWNYSSGWKYSVTTKHDNIHITNEI
jgi:hypothetical protein